MREKFISDLLIGLDANNIETPLIKHSLNGGYEISIPFAILYLYFHKNVIVVNLKLNVEETERDFPFCYVIEESLFDVLTLKLKIVTYIKSFLHYNDHKYRYFYIDKKLQYLIEYLSLQYLIEYL